MTKSAVLAKGVLKDAGAMISTLIEGVVSGGADSCSAEISPRLKTDNFHGSIDR